MSVPALDPDRLYRECDPAELGVSSTEELEDLPGLAAQDRALEAIRFGIGIERTGYNLFVFGPSGAGKRDAVLRYLQEKAASEPAPPDWVYVNNFKVPYKPCALKLEPGEGAALEKAMEDVIAELRQAIPALLESEEYRNRREAIDETYSKRQEEAFSELRDKATQENVTLLRTPAGFALAPVREGEVIKPDAFNALPEEERRAIEETIQQLQKELASVIENLPGWEKKRREEIDALNEEIATAAVERAMAEVHSRFGGNGAVTSWLETVREDLIANIRLFAPGTDAEGAQNPIAMMMAAAAAQKKTIDPEQRYAVNVIVGKETGAESEANGAPIVYEDHPALGNLVGRAEHLSQFGALTTDFTLIKPGSLHRANGGYLLLDVLSVLRQPLAWEALKRALRAGKITVESAADYMSLVATVSLEPEPIPLDIKVILFGDPLLYYLLSANEPEFHELFKVAAEFDDVIDRDGEGRLLFARMIAGLARREDLLPFDAGGIAAMVERASRLAADAEKLAVIDRPIADLMREADYVARQEDASMVAAEHIEKAYKAQIERSDRIRERSHEAITRDIVLVETSGSEVGQINGLSVLGIGGFSFGKPTRITARVRMGGTGAKVVDIEREVELGGPLHSKGVLILSGYLNSTFMHDRPLSLAATLVFEQSYGGVDGDSASSAELYALLSALSGFAIGQNFAVTGSVNQMGEIQAIGGVNEKIEGFFDICSARGLTGDQAVLIPAANVKHLMLRRDVVEAVGEGHFAVYAVGSVEEGVELLMGAPAGKRDGDGRFPEGSVFAAVEERLSEFAEARRRFVKSDGEEAGSA